MAERLVRARREEEARDERRRSLQARSALNARKGFVHGLRVGDVDAVEHGVTHVRRRAAEGVRGGKAGASESGVGPHPRPRWLGGGCVGCRWKGGCTPRHVILGECSCPRVGWAAYLRRLADALRAIEKVVPRTPLDLPR